MDFKIQSDCTIVSLSHRMSFYHVQGLLSTAPEVVEHSLTPELVHAHNHGGHHHGIDMEHPALALTMTIVSISVKEGY